jgi:hypothetical protein
MSPSDNAETILRFGHEVLNAGDGAADTVLGVALNLLGTAGWELARIDSSPASSDSSSYDVFKRQLAE